MSFYCFIVVLLAAIGMQEAGAGKGKIVIAGGFVNRSHVDTVQMLDIESGDWSYLASLPQGDSDITLLALDNQVLAFGGYENPRFASIYNTASDSWTPIIPLPTAVKRGAQAFAAGGTIYLCGGEGNPHGLLILEKGGYTWKVGPNSIYGNTGGIGAAVGSTFYTCVDNSQDCEKYDATFNTWSVISSRLEARLGSRMVGQGGIVYNVGGTFGKNEKFDPKTGQWSYFAAMTLYRRYFGLASDGQVIYAIGGWNDKANGVTDMVELYTPETDTWRQVSYKISSARGSFEAVFVADFSSTAGPLAEVLAQGALNITAEKK